MSESASRLAPLSSSYDLKLACSQCSVKEKEISYALNSLQHQCQRNLLLCRVRGGSKWRPVARRPLFPNPSQYVVCDYFVENFGCTRHKNRCTFARSDEEAAVWNFVKCSKIDHVLLCNLIAQSEMGPGQLNKAETLSGLLATVDLKVVCDLCSIKDKEITYRVRLVSHTCRKTLLLAKAKGSDEWRPVSERPTSSAFGRNVNYQKCHFFVEGSGCTQHGQSCTYARSFEEATVWNYGRDNDLDQDQLLSLICQAQATLLTPEIAAKNILHQFSGEFMEFCKDCFHGSPQKLATKRWNDTCSADAAHKWDPVLVHHLSENSGKHIYSQVRPLPHNCQLIYCSHVRQGKPCWHKPDHCKSAQSEVEMAVWIAELSGVSIRPHLRQLGQQAQGEHRQVSMYCKVCLLVLSSPESFYKHCSSLEHAQLLSEDTTTRWRGRQPPHNRRAELWLCQRPATCEYGIKCPKAHTVEELQEWLMRAEEEKEIRHNIEAQGLMSYNERLLDEYKNSSNEVHIISEHVDDVSIVCDEDLTQKCEQVNATLEWNFHVETERELLHVALLKQEPGASFTLDDSTLAPCIYCPGERFHSEDVSYDITVSFTSINPGRYEQWLVLDFDMRPVLLRKLRVSVGQVASDDIEQPAVNGGAAFQRAERWHRGNRVIVPCSSRTEEQDNLLKEYKPPQLSFSYRCSPNIQTPLNNENYKDRMHHFLYNEEKAEDQVISRLNVCGEIKTHCSIFGAQSGLTIAPPGQLFCTVSMGCNLTPDTPEGLVLKRNIQSALVAPVSSDHNSKVYEASILQDKSRENEIYLQLSKQCCADLKLKMDTSYEMEVQFQQDRSSFCAMHKAVDLLPDTSRVLPDLQTCVVPVNDNSYNKLNIKQQSAIRFITGSCTGKGFVAPLLIYGPFGTGKTFTLAEAARELCKQPHNKVLICTHTNSSADLYIRDHFHPFIKDKSNDIKPVRIKANREIAFLATDEITLKYCSVSEEGTYFLPPTKAILDRHTVVVTTTTMAKHFYDLKLPEGYFTHILIDEASQMLECEALMALGLAGPNTRVVLAGDHMQMGPKLFSVDDHHRSNHTLLNRLFHYYQEQKCNAAQNSRIIFNENYRSTKEIVEFVSTHFYVGKNDVIKASGSIPAPANGHALKMYHVRGECVLDTFSMSWYNGEVVDKVLKAVKEIIDHWPSAWGCEDLSTICVLSEGCQTKIIRNMLSRQRLRNVHAENVANVQGKQFRAVIIAVVQTRDSLKTSDVSGLELFNDARVLNTAMTRAQSQVVVVGDAVALSCFGKCSEIWKSYINHCISNNSVVPQYYTKGFFEKDVMETSRFQKTKHVEESNTPNDAILKELRDEFEQLEAEDEFENSHYHESRSNCVYEVDSHVGELCKKQPEIYKEGTLFRESYNRGYVVPFNNPTRRIPINGRASLGRGFTGDHVILQSAKVVSVTKEAQSARVLVCILEEEDHSKPRYSEDNFVRRTMISITKTAPNVRILVIKKRRNFIPIWEPTYWSISTYRRINEELRQNNMFVVQVIGWRANCYLPLGRVIRIISVGSPLDALRALNVEFNIAPNTHKPEEGLSRVDNGEMHRQDMLDVVTFTVDPPEAKDLDDAISVMETKDHYELGVHIADVASFVSRDSALDRHAEQQGATFYCSRENPNHMFHQRLSTECFSLLKGQTRRVVSLMVRVNKQTNEIIGEPKFQLSKIKSKHRLSYEDAEKMICGSAGTDGVDKWVRVAYAFAQSQRKRRQPKDWAYSRTDSDRVPGKRKAHLMIEELSVLFNTHAAKTLNRSERTEHCTPLRCQEGPHPEKVEELKEQCRELIPVSFFVRHICDHDQRNDENVIHCGNFRILSEVWKDIKSAAKEDDTDKLVDLIAADDIYPLLQPVTDQFRRCLSKAYVICSKSPKSDVGHYSLNVKYYTQATSPIRRYMDLILQRLLHSVICGRPALYKRTEIMDLCNQFEHNLKNAKEYEQRAEQIFFALRMKKQSASKVAFVVSAQTERESFTVSFPFNKNVFAERLSIMYKDLQLDDQPLYDKTNHCMILRWKRRIYSASSTQIRQEIKMKPASGPCLELPLKIWTDIIKAIDTENWPHAKNLILNNNPGQVTKGSHLSEASEEAPGFTSLSEKKETPNVHKEHEVDICLQLQAGDTLQVQMTSEIKRGTHMPAVQLVHVTPKFEICVDHVHNPIMCFSRSADEPSKFYYGNTDEYVRIWKPLCEMESAATAVGESDGILIENLVVAFTQQQKDLITGSFFLRQSWIKKWAIECNLSKCLLCIRKRGLKADHAPEHSAAVDPKEFTWVAHGVTCKTELKKTPVEGTQVEFYINHLPMETIPDCVFLKNTDFTVEIIPKLLPDIRKENAVVSVTSACDLVKRIALGSRIPKQVQAQWNVVRKKLPNVLPDLNQSQRLAVDKALNNTFTLIQGPPGTGKTVLGVYIVYCFLDLNSKNPRISVDPKDGEKKEVILYCGPSNKSVDVVAEYLLRFGDLVKPLRVYSQMVEMLDYPYPDFELQFSQRTFRPDHSKTELRRITLHHRMREDHNPFSRKIKEFDKRIELALKKKEAGEEAEELTDEEVETYKKLLRDARVFELKQHDIILCTCTTSSTPSLTKTVSARQILIDECAMATEPQALIPLVCNKPEKVVLIGDHKQLRPIVKNMHVKKLGMARSLFERYYISQEQKAVMLDTQYRMHENICKFPSHEYYEGKLKTEVERPNSVLRVEGRTMQIVFGDIKGETISLVVNTPKGNENSKANKEERHKVVDIAEQLVNVAKVEQQSIVILSPYNAQVSEIRDELNEKEMKGITVTTITKSQGSEWRYVIISTVCSLLSKDIERDPDRGWLSKHLGFVSDPNQVNVGITRAKEGLCIIGDQELLSCSPTWKNLLKHYRSHNAVTDAKSISVASHS